jgi:hypothetical protein
MQTGEVTLSSTRTQVTFGIVVTSALLTIAGFTYKSFETIVSVHDGLAADRTESAKFRADLLSTLRARPTWEYKVSYVMPAVLERTGAEAFRAATVTPSEEELRVVGQEGWELVSSYLEQETAYANFGNDKFVTGLQPNVRPQRLVLLFRRRT